MSSPHSDNEGNKGYSSHMRGVAWGILVMGVSLAVIITLYIGFGHIGPAFSTQIMQQQQESLRKQYGLPPEAKLSTEMLEVPPSLRSIAASTNASSTGTNASSTGTTGNATGTNATNAGDTSISIVSGASSLTNTAYDPNPVQIKVGSKVTWTNNDSQPHTVTSGSNGQPDNKFNSSPSFNPLLNPGQTFSFTFTEAGEYPYFCMLHPNMVGTVSVS
ncbi:MAG: plastocyanin/azurin family copper-binding protein [Nitrososphaera sp.]